MIEIQVKGVIPKIMTAGSVGADLIANEDVTIEPNQTVLVPTGSHFAIPPGLMGLLAPRSSLHKRNLILANQVGIIDQDYRGEVKAALMNLGPIPVTIAKGERIVQLCFLSTPMDKIGFDPVDSLDETERGEGGFGSTTDK